MWLVLTALTFTLTARRWMSKLVATCNLKLPNSGGASNLSFSFIQLRIGLLLTRLDITIG